MITVLAGTGMLGSGFSEASLWSAVEKGVDVIGCDAGSNDQGPFNLGSARPFVTGSAYRRDLDLLLRASRKARVPLIIGSAGGAGADPQVDETAELVRALAREHGLRFRMGLIYTEQRVETVRAWIRQGRIAPLYPSSPLAEPDLEGVVRVVAQIGAEPFIDALDRGCDVIIAGRSCDTAIFAAVPLRAGCDSGLAWHAAKLLECGAASTQHRLAPDCITVRIYERHFVIEPPNPALLCTPQSVLAHTLYENPDPFQFTEPSGTLDVSATEYEPETARAVRVSGSRFLPATRYTVKLEGARLRGFRSIVVGGIRDPFILKQLGSYITRCLEKVDTRVQAMYGGRLGPRDYQIRVKTYGAPDAESGIETDGRLEVGLLLDILTETQERATEIAQAARLIFLHNPIPEWTGQVTNVALPYGLNDLDVGPAYDFALNHVVAADDPLETSRLETADVG